MLAVQVDVERASPRTLIIQTGAFLLYQWPAGWIVLIAPGFWAGWTAALAFAAYLWTASYRRRGLADSRDLVRVLGSVLVLRTLLDGLPIVGAALSPRDDVLPFLVGFVLWLGATVAGVALGLNHAEPASAQVRLDAPPPPAPAIDTFLGVPPRHDVLPDPYDDARHTLRVED